MHTQQLALSFDPDMAEQYRSLKECVASRVYNQRGGIAAVAGKLDLSPSHLSEVLGGGGDRHRKFDLALRHHGEFAVVNFPRQLAPVMEAAGLTQAPAGKRAR